VKASVIIPTYNRRDLVGRTLRTLFEQNFPPSEFEIIVVVDGSTDGTCAVLRAVKSPCRLRIIEQENCGPSGARNAGFCAAEGEVVIFLDDDMLCDATLVREHVAAHQCEQPVIGFGAIFLSGDSPASLPAECFKRELGAYYLEHMQNPGTPGEESPCVFCNTSALRRVLLKTGGFDERFRKREDAELAVRLFAAGLRPRYVNTAIAYQYYKKTIADLIRDAEAFAVADLMLVSKHPDRLPHTFLGRIANEPKWKRAARRIAAAYPSVVDTLLAPVCRVSQVNISSRLLRHVGVRALQVRRGVHWYHRILQLQRSNT
jgi:GT2 family glycosyltransferase